MQKLTSVLFLERPLAQYCDGELKGEHTDVASSLAAKKVEQKHLKVIIKEPYSYSSMYARAAGKDGKNRKKGRKGQQRILF